MEYAAEFERDFMRRTLQLVRTYTGPHDATLLLNCLLGLLIVPKETSLARIPLDPIASLEDWGISPGSIERAGRHNATNTHPETLRGVVYNLRNAVAHFRFEPRHANREVMAFHFTDASGFTATIAVAEMRIFVERLAEYLERTTQDDISKRADEAGSATGAIG